MAARADGTIRRTPAGGRRRAGVGIALIVAAGAVGVATAWDRSPGPEAWVAREAIAAGSALDPAAFDSITVGVPDPSLLWPAGTPPAGVAAHSLQPGEPLFVGGTEPAGGGSLVTVPVPAELLPAGLIVGDTVDVWEGGSSPALTDASVTAVTDDQTGTGRVELAVGAADTATAVRLATAERLVLVRR